MEHGPKMTGSKERKTKASTTSIVVHKDQKKQKMLYSALIGYSLCQREVEINENIGRQALLWSGANSALSKSSRPPSVDCFSSMKRQKRGKIPSILLG